MRAIPVLMFLLLLPAAAWAQEDAEQTRLFLHFEGDSATVLEDAKHRFVAAVTPEGFAIAETVETEALLVDCRGQIGVSATAERECRLQAARRIFVDQVLVLAMRSDGDVHELTLEAVDPDSNSNVFTTFAEVHHKDPAHAAKEGLRILANGYLCFRGRAAYCVVASATSEEGGLGSTATDVGCPFGMEANDDTQGRCCWPNQVWAGTRCVGTPSYCPAGYRADADAQTCVLPACPTGMQRPPSATTCCWAGQGWSQSQNACVGRPECPEGHVLRDDTCLDDPDGDGIFGAADACPTDAEDRDGLMDDDGCPEDDADDDGLADTVDACPMTAEDADGYDDADGCPESGNMLVVTGWSLVGTGAVLFGIGAWAGLEASALADEYNGFGPDLVQGTTFNEMESLREDAELYDLIELIKMSTSKNTLLVGAILALGFDDNVDVRVGPTEDGVVMMMGGTF